MHTHIYIFKQVKIHYTVYFNVVLDNEQAPGGPCLAQHGSYQYAIVSPGNSDPVPHANTTAPSSCHMLCITGK